MLSVQQSRTLCQCVQHKTREQIPKRQWATQLSPGVVLSHSGASAMDKTKVLTLNLLVNDIYTKAVLDTGADQNVVRKDMIKDYTPHRYARNLTVAGGQKVATLGEVKITVKIGTRIIGCKATVIENLPVPLILGMEFLKTHNAIIDLETGQVTLRKDTKNPLTVNTDILHSRTSSSGHLPFNYKKSYHQEAKQCINLILTNNKEKSLMANSTVTDIPESEFKTFLKDKKNYDMEIITAKIEEKNKDIFEVDVKYDLAQCVSADPAMKQGIAKNFRTTFGGIEELKHQQPTIGKAMSLHRGTRNIYHLVTKQNYWDNPTLEAIWNALTDLRHVLIRHNRKHLAMPRLACGLDKQDWDTIKRMIHYIFHNVEIDILLCSKIPEDQTYPTNTAIVHSEDIPTQTEEQPEPQACIWQTKKA